MMKFILYMLILLSSLTSSKGQSISFSRVGVIGQLPTGGYASSLATSFNNAVDCIKLNTGVTLFSGLFGGNEFYDACKPILSNELLGFSLFPNPVVNYTRLVASGIPVSLHTISIVIVDALGRTILKTKIDPRVLRTGYVVNASSYLSGNYFLRVHGDGFSRVIPFVKVQ
jgi:hypothetical protein